MASVIQLEGNIKFGATFATLTDYSAEVTQLTIHKARNTVEVPGTFFNAQADQRAGTKNHTLEVVFFTDMATTSLWDELETAIETSTAEVWWGATFFTGGVSASNPHYYGKAIVTNLDTGGVVGDLRSQSLTFPIVSGYPLKDLIS